MNNESETPLTDELVDRTRDADMAEFEADIIDHARILECRLADAESKLYSARFILGDLHRPSAVNALSNMNGLPHGVNASALENILGKD